MSRIIIKICGLKDVETASAAAAMGADMIGLVFAASSRRVTVQTAAKITAGLPRRIKKVGVFVDAVPQLVNETAQYCSLDYVQLHGNESPEYCRQISYPIIKAFSCGKNFSAEAANRYPVQYILLDSYVAGKSGGTGRTFGWQEKAEEIAAVKQPVLIAGGLDSSNVGEMINLLKPAGVDVSGGVETAGIKDLLKIKGFIETVRKMEVRKSAE